MNTRESMFLSPASHSWAVLIATTRSYLKRFSAYLIELIRWPLGPVLTFAAWRITYGVSGRGQVDGATLSGFLLIGVFGYITWTSAIWASGYALQWERHEGTSGALFLSPANRAAVVAGYGVGSFLWFLPSFAAISVLGLLTGARIHVVDPLALLCAAVALILASLSCGFLLSGLFILSRRGNLIANVMQSPVYLLSGLLIPISFLPGWLQPFANALPVTHAAIALRQASLLGGTLGDAAGQLGLALGLAALYFLLGLLGLRRVEHVAKRFGQLELV